MKGPELAWLAPGEPVRAEAQAVLGLGLAWRGHLAEGLTVHEDALAEISAPDESALPPRIKMARGWLRLFVLRLNGEPAASLYAFRYNHVFYFYQSGFDPAYGKYSVGLVTMALSIKAAIEEGAEEYDFLRGDERYKFQWTNTVREIGKLVISPPRMGGAWYQGASQFSRGSRRLARRLLPKTLADAIAGGLRALEEWIG